MQNSSPFEDYVPEGTYSFFLSLKKQYPFSLKIITRRRKTRLGDFRVIKGNEGVITINSNLNQYSFAVTLLHEIAHLMVWRDLGNRIEKHGIIWKSYFSNLLNLFCEYNLPQDVKNAIRIYMKNPKASRYSDYKLAMVLNRYDIKHESEIFLGELKEGELFLLLSNGRKYIRGIKLRTRIVCVDLESKGKYLINVAALVRRE